MALVEHDKMTTLYDASQSAATAATALDDIQLKAVAFAINSAANSGETSTTFSEDLRQATLDALKAKNYTIQNIGKADPSKLKLISWKTTTK